MRRPIAARNNNHEKVNAAIQCRFVDASTAAGLVYCKSDETRHPGIATRHPSMFLAGIQCLLRQCGIMLVTGKAWMAVEGAEIAVAMDLPCAVEPKTLDACLRRHDENFPDSSVPAQA